MAFLGNTGKKVSNPRYGYCYGYVVDTIGNRVKVRIPSIHGYNPEENELKAPRLDEGVTNEYTAARGVFVPDDSLPLATIMFPVLNYWLLATGLERNGTKPADKDRLGSDYQNNKCNPWRTIIGLSEETLTATDPKELRKASEAYVLLSENFLTKYDLVYVAFAQGDIDYPIIVGHAGMNLLSGRETDTEV